MSLWKCSHVQDQFERLISRELSPEEHQQALEHIHACSECRGHWQLYRRVSAVMQNNDAFAMHSKVEEALLRRALGVTENPASVPNPIRRRARLFYFAAAAAIVALLGVFFYLLRDTSLQGGSRPQFPGDPTTIAQSSEAVLPKTTAPRIETASFIQWKEGVKIWLEPNSQVSIIKSTVDLDIYFLYQGKMIVSIAHHPPEYRFVIQTARGEVEALGTVFSVEVSSDSRATTTVLRGAVEVRGKLANKRSEASTIRVDAGFTGTVGDKEQRRAPLVELAQDACVIWECAAKDTPMAILGRAYPALLKDVQTGPAPLPGRPDDTASMAAENRHTLEKLFVGEGPDTLHYRALEMRANNQWKDAERVYSQLMERFPNTDYARDSLVFMGQMYLDGTQELHRAKTAFEDYLRSAPNGALVRQARLWLVEVHVRMGDSAGTVRSATDYMKNHQNSSEAPRVLYLRGRAFEIKGDCQKAQRDFKTLVDWYPGTPAADQASHEFPLCH